MIIANNTAFYAALKVINRTGDDVLKNFAVLRLLTFTAEDSASFAREAFEEFYASVNWTLYPRYYLRLSSSTSRLSVSLFSSDEYCLKKVLGHQNGIGFTHVLLHTDEDKLTKVVPTTP